MAFKTSGVDQNVCMLGMSEVVTAFYLRLTVADKPGVLADVTRILANQNISIEAMIQRQAEDESGQADIVLLTHRCIEGDFNAAMVEIEALDAVVEPMVRVRVEDLS